MDTKFERLLWHTEQRRVSDLSPCAYNPRKLSIEQKEQLIKSLQKFNLAEIPAINLDNKILAGHQRVAVLLALGRGGRRCYMMELDPKYCDVIVKRWEQYTGLRAVLK